MKNLQRKALPDLPSQNKKAVNYLKLVSSDSSDLNDYSCDLAEDFLFDLDNKITNFIKFKKAELVEGIQEIINQEYNFAKDSIKNSAIDYALNEGEYSVDVTSEGEYYYKSPIAESQIDDAADEVVLDCLLALSIESYKLATGCSDIL